MVAASGCTRFISFNPTSTELVYWTEGMERVWQLSAYWRSIHFRNCLLLKADHIRLRHDLSFITQYSHPLMIYYQATGSSSTTARRIDRGPRSAIHMGLDPIRIIPDPPVGSYLSRKTRCFHSPQSIVNRQSSTGLSNMQQKCRY